MKASTANIANRHMIHPLVSQVGTQYAHQRTTSAAGMREYGGILTPPEKGMEQRFNARFAGQFFLLFCLAAEPELVSLRKLSDVISSARFTWIDPLDVVALE